MEYLCIEVLNGQPHVHCQAASVAELLELLEFGEDQNSYAVEVVKAAEKAKKDFILRPGRNAKRVRGTDLWIQVC